MRVQVLGRACARCKRFTHNAEQALRELGLDVWVEKIDDDQAIALTGVISTPALIVDGHVKVAGKLLSADEIKALLRSEAVARA